MMAFFSKTPPKKPDKCKLCHKYQCQCARNKLANEKAKKQIVNKAGRSQTVTVNTGNKVDARGNVWCPKCSCRVVNGSCTNIRCANH